jgi:hypothetical protein
MVGMRFPFVGKPKNKIKIKDLLLENNGCRGAWR